MSIAIRTTLGSCLAIRQITETRSCYEDPPGRSKTVRTAVGRSIFPADGIGRTSKPAAGGGEPADRRGVIDRQHLAVCVAGNQTLTAAKDFVGDTRAAEPETGPMQAQF